MKKGTFMQHSLLNRKDINELEVFVYSAGLTSFVNVNINQSVDLEILDHKHRSVCKVRFVIIRQ
jgi:hypothetical protein